MTTRTQIESGQLLLAEPFMVDPYFRRAVVLLCEQHSEGALGFILNKSINMPIHELVPDFPPIESEVFYGGPVQTDTLHFLHNLGDLISESQKITNGVWFGGDFDELKFLASSGMISPDNVRFFVGYSGWSPGQLVEEMELGSWVVADMHPNYLFKSNPEQLWSQVMYNKGEQFEILANMPSEMVWN